MTPEERERLKVLLLSGGASGALIGGVSSLAGGAGKWGQVAKAAGLAGLASGGLAAGSGYLGGKLIGDDPDDATHNAKSGALGGLLAGAAGGLSLGALLKVPGVRNWALKKIGGSAGILGKAINDVPLGKLAAGTGLAGAGVGAFQGYDEGMQADFIENVAKLEREKKRKQLLQESGYA